MNYPPPTSPSPASVRNRRADRSKRPAAGRQPEPPRDAQPNASATPGRSPRAGRISSSGKKAAKPAARKAGGRKKTALGLTWWQGLILMVMAAGVLSLSLSLGRAQDSLRALEAQRREAEEKYRQEVRSHQVRYRDEIRYYAAVNRIDPAYVAAIIKRESDYDPRAVSRVGAMGLMQFMPDTFAWVAPKCGLSRQDTDAVYEPENAIKMGCYLLKYISDMYSGDPLLVACAYHAGWGNVNSWLKNYSSDGKHLTLSQIPTDDTRYYAGKVLNAYAIYQQYYY